MFQWSEREATGERNQDRGGGGGVYWREGEVLNQPSTPHFNASGSQQRRQWKGWHSRSLQVAE